MTSCANIITMFIMNWVFKKTEDNFKNLILNEQFCLKSFEREQDQQHFQTCIRQMLKLSTLFLRFCNTKRNFLLKKLSLTLKNVFFLSCQMHRLPPYTSENKKKQKLYFLEKNHQQVIFYSFCIGTRKLLKQLHKSIYNQSIS